MLRKPPDLCPHSYIFAMERDSWLNPSFAAILVEDNSIIYFLQLRPYLIGGCEDHSPLGNPLCP